MSMVLLQPAVGELPLAEEADRSPNLPARYYYDPAVYEAEKEAIFFRTWQYAAHHSQLDAPGRFVTTRIHDQEVFLICGADHTVRAFYNVCAHRAHPLVEGIGQRSRITCPYHAWTYALDGKLLHARGGERMTHFDRHDICLSEVRVDRLLDFYFINLDPNAAALSHLAPSLADDIWRSVPRIDELVLREGRQILPLETAANWKVCVDNYLECYHCEPAHPTFCELMDVARTEIECDGIVSRQYVPRTENWSNGAYPIHPDDPVKDGHFWFLWPNTAIVSVPGAPNVFISKFDPLAPERSERRTHSFGLSIEPSEQERLRDAWAPAFVGAEDVSLCESVQRGLRQRGYTQGRYIVDPDHHNITELPLHFFHSLYLSAMEETRGT